MDFTQIKETCLYVRDLEQTKQFYHEKLGLPLISHVEGRHVFFRAGSSVLLCFNPEVTKREETLPPHFGEGKLHLAFETSPENYDAWKEKIAAEGIAIVHEQPWGKRFHSFYFYDPDGHCLEIVERGMWDPS